MNCERVREELVALLDDELAPEPKAAVKTHLGTCSRCAAEEGALRATRALVSEALAARPSAHPRFEELWSVAAAAEAAAAARSREPRRRSAPRIGGHRRSAANRGSRRVAGGARGRRIFGWAIAACAVAVALLAGREALRNVPAESGRIAARSGGTSPPAEVAVAPRAVVSLEDVPAELRAHPDMFTDFVIVRRLDKLRRLPELLAESGNGEAADRDHGRS